MAKKTLIDSKIAHLFPVGLSKLGTAVDDNVEFEPVIYTDLDGVEKRTKRLVIDNCNLTVNHPKRIIKSVIQGKLGTAQQYINHDDYQIELNGTLDGNTFNNLKDNIFQGGASDPISLSHIIGGIPMAELQVLVDIEKAPRSIPIKSKLLNMGFRIENVVIEDITISNADSRNRLGLNISMISSDNEISLDNFL